VRVFIQIPSGVSQSRVLWARIFSFFFRIQFRKIVLNPLQKLTDSMKDAQIANHEDVTLGAHDEFQLLGETYNQMRQGLENAHEKLSEINERLEQLVEARTAELQRVNQELMHDIAKREQIETALQQSEKRYRSLVENTMDGYFICQIPSGRFLFLNKISIKVQEALQTAGATK